MSSFLDRVKAGFPAPWKQTQEPVRVMAAEINNVNPNTGRYKRRIEMD